MNTSKMITATLNYPNINSNVTLCVNHMLSKLNLGEYQKFLETAMMFPAKEHNFTVFEYVQSQANTLILRSERLSGCITPIHNIVNDLEFDSNMRRLFLSTNNMSWDVRTKLDNSKPIGMQQLTDIRQVILTILPDEDLDDMPDLIPISYSYWDEPCFVPVPDYTYDYSDMPGLIPV